MRFATRIASFDKQTIMDTKRLVDVAACRLISKSNPVECMRCFDGTTGHAAENQSAVRERVLQTWRRRKSLGRLRRTLSTDNGTASNGTP